MRLDAVSRPDDMNVSHRRPAAARETVEKDDVVCGKLLLGS
jgi:hypothetical protein